MQRAFRFGAAGVIRGLCAVLLLVQLVACGGAKQAQVRTPHPRMAEVVELVDSAPPEGFDLDSVQQPVPRDEPRARYGNHSPYYVFGKRYEVLPDHRGYVARGTASWYGTKFHGRLTSNREPYDMYAYTAAHKSLPLPCYAQVTNLENGRSVVVRVNDRGPFVGDRLIDLSYVAAVKLGMHVKGTAPVEVRVLEPVADPAVLTTAAAPVVPPSVVTALPMPVDAAPAVTVSADPPQMPAQSQYFQQCGAFGALDNARMLQGRLRGAGIDTVAVVTTEGAASHRVLVGPFTDREAAAAFGAELDRRGFPGCRVFSR